VVWTGIIGVTCLLLVLLEHMLWLVLPFIFGTVMYYMLLGPMQRLLRLGFSRKRLVDAGVRRVLRREPRWLLVAALSWSAGPAMPTPGTTRCRCT
jgi:hypothetical protein